ncbi:hypothetical protein TI39_contig276g00004 [Zymoseptoria brevis]|uniref:RRM domain-containing protein n=1 Tax=Zymoseptoria brevis TaxID=1047168 RepID=A0A0F4H079_9PEZI|nr:hypothetical protein TI39_contig276g00004 [Zymoseptoria brevis]
MTRSTKPGHAPTSRVNQVNDSGKGQQVLSTSSSKLQQIHGTRATRSADAAGSEGLPICVSDDEDDDPPTKRQRTTRSAYNEPSLSSPIQRARANNVDNDSSIQQSETEEDEPISVRGFGSKYLLSGNIHRDNANRPDIGGLCHDDDTGDDEVEIVYEKRLIRSAHKPNHFSHDLLSTNNAHDKATVADVDGSEEDRENEAGDPDVSPSTSTNHGNEDQDALTISIDNAEDVQSDSRPAGDDTVASDSVTGAPNPAAEAEVEEAVEAAEVTDDHHHRERLVERSIPEMAYESDWVHDRFEGERYDRSQRHAPIEDDRYAPRGAATTGGSKIRVDNIHYELTENDLRELFERIGPVASVRLLYDRADRSQGTAFVIYEDPRDASDAVQQFDGQNANGQAIRMTLLPAGPAPPAPRGSLFDRIEKPPRSLFDRIDNGPDPRDDSRRRRQRSDSPRRGGGGRAASDVDRYVPGGARGGDRSPIRRRGTPREGGRRPGARREESGTGGRGGRGGRRPRTDEQGHELVGGRPRKTAEELDAEMADYWGSKGGDDAPAGNGEAAAANNGANGGAGDIDMDI